MEKATFAMAERLAGYTPEAPASRSDVTSWWGKRGGITGKTLLLDFVYRGWAEDFIHQADGKTYKRIRLTDAGRAALDAERSARACAAGRFVGGL